LRLFTVAMPTSSCHSVSSMWCGINSTLCFTATSAARVSVWRRCLATMATTATVHSIAGVPVGTSGASFSWRMAVLEPHTRCPLPGGVGIGHEDFDHQLLAERKRAAAAATAPPPFVLPPSALPAVSVLPPCLDSERSKTVQEAFNLVEETFPVGSYPRAAAGVEFSLAACPQVLKKHLTALFPRRSLDSLTVITVAHRGRDAAQPPSQLHQSLLDSLVMTASEICQALRQEGFWSDFIDPANGRPFLTADAASTSSSNDQAQQANSGIDFEITDLGFCKLVLHRQSQQIRLYQSDQASIGSQVFTDAPPDHPLLLNLIKPQQGSSSSSKSS
ncbi:hypothetical protein BOX15_Mlig032691g2, partial [Macrostomum lignano]